MIQLDPTDSGNEQYAPSQKNRWVLKDKIHPGMAGDEQTGQREEKREGVTPKSETN